MHRYLLPLLLLICARNGFAAVGHDYIWEIPTPSGWGAVVALLEGDEPSANCFTFAYDDRGLEVSQTGAFGMPQARTVPITWHPTLFLPAAMTEPKRVTNYSYGENEHQFRKELSLLNKG